MTKRRVAKAYRPNVVPKGERLFSLVLGTSLLAYGLVGLLGRKLDLHGSRVRIAVFEGGPAILMAAALLVGAAIVLSTVIDHHDPRDSEDAYQRFRWGAKLLGSCLVVAALVSHLYIGFVK